MRDMKLLAYVFLTAIVGGCCGACDSRSVSVPTQLMDGFVSQQDGASIDAQLMGIGGVITVIEDGKNEEKPSFFRTPLSHKVLSVSGYVYLGSRGELRLEFVNDELASTWFIPDDPQGFEIAFSDQLKGVATRTPMRVDPATEIRVGVDYRGKKYWAWEDINLREELDRWIRNNS